MHQVDKQGRKTKSKQFSRYSNLLLFTLKLFSKYKSRLVYWVEPEGSININPLYILATIPSSFLILSNPPPPTPLPPPTPPRQGLIFGASKRLYKWRKGKLSVVIAHILSKSEQEMGKGRMGGGGRRIFRT
jgi:hypothetical protein